jgi:hypothetical protein
MTSTTEQQAERAIQVDDRKPTPRSRRTPTLEQIKSAVELSGYLLEARIAQKLGEVGFYANPNAYVEHPITKGELIEIDVDGGNEKTILNEKSVVLGSAGVRLFIECKNNEQPLAVFLKQERHPRNNAWRIVHSGPPATLEAPQFNNPDVPVSLGACDWHHYCQPTEIATQFCTFKSQNGTWAADSSEKYRNSLNKLCLAVAGRAPRAASAQAGMFCVRLHYPILVLQGGLVAVSAVAEGTQVKPIGHVQLHRSARIGGKTLRLQIDIVTESHFPHLLEAIAAEFATLVENTNELRKELLSEVRRESREAIKRLTEEAERRLT